MKRIYLLLIGLVVVAGLVFFSYEKKEDDDWEQKRKIWEINETTVYQWEVDLEEYKLTAITKQGKYYVTEPKVMETTENAFLANVKNFNTCEYVSVVSDSTNHETNWGINRSESFSIYFKDRKGRPQKRTLYAGDETTAPKGFYVVAEDQNKIYSVEHWVVAALSKRIEHMHVYEFLGIDPDEITKMKFPTITVVKKGMFYQLNGKPQDTLDKRKVDDLVETVGFLRADWILTHSEASEIDFSDSTKVLVEYKKNEERDLSQETPLSRDLPVEGSRDFEIVKHGELCYARVLGQSLVYKISTQSFDNIKRPFSFYQMEQ